jgi:hypothetical protein
MKQVFINSGKELLRIVALSVIPVVIAGLEGDNFNWKIVWPVAAIAALRFFDKLLHEYGKEKSTKKKESWAVKGLTRF